MKVMIYYAGCVERVEKNDEIEDLINWTEIELERVPQRGEMVDLWLGDYWLQGTVTHVYTAYCPPNNPHIKERAWGDRYAISVGDIDIMEYYGDRV